MSDFRDGHRTYDEQTRRILELEARIREMQSAMRQHAHALDVEAANFDISLLEAEQRNWRA